ncbi:flagellar basal body protein FliL [Paenibacillus darwinianus]|uniref:Flagellar protein FliL n=1 Tax=Paenibacillus darwinianus TaxID=1380763 RepID=A0A9W5S2U5_9BACL|nr:flagellar basal body-associated FliL family protein [Paenibacillus darwinianus]EXX91335.1 flagellar basal body protein FliL [Paenibacillus darwinianus]EXX92298.1 flagellar basal body protein FliL [Paenibacillus darwinianus]EXX92835.1 flagellar basal body protein FliL [Paenibacillus darwinianus]
MKKMLPWLITILLAIALIAVVAVFLFNQFFNDSGKDAKAAAIQSVETVKPEKISASERLELTAEIQDIKTNLLDTDYIVLMSFAFQLDSKKTKEDFDKIKDIQIRPIILRTLSDMSPEQFTGSKGKDAFTAKLLNLINLELPEKSKLTKVEITNFIITTI